MFREINNLPKVLQVVISRVGIRTYDLPPKPVLTAKSSQGSQEGLTGLALPVFSCCAFKLNKSLMVDILS